MKTMYTLCNNYLLTGNCLVSKQTRRTENSGYVAYLYPTVRYS